MSTRRRPQPTITVRSHNIPARTKDELVELAVRRLKEDADVVIWQEGIHIGDDFKEWMKGFDVYNKPKELVGPLPICVRRSSATVLEHFHETAYPDTRVGPWGAGPSVLAQGTDNAVRIRRGDRRAVIINAHLVPSVSQSPEKVRREQGEAAYQNLMKRRELHRLEIAQLVEMSSRYNNVIIGGDFNCKPDYPGLKPLYTAGFKRANTGATHGRSTIDHFFYKGRLEVVSSRVMPRTASDHRPIEAVFTWTPRRARS